MMSLRLILALLTLAPVALSAPKAEKPRRETPVLAGMGFPIPQPEPPRKKSIRIIYSDEEVEIVDEPVDKFD